MACPEGIVQDVNKLNTSYAVMEEQISAIRSEITAVRNHCHQENRETNDRIDAVLTKHDESFKAFTDALEKLKKSQDTLRWVFICYILVTIGQEAGMGTVLKLLLGVG